MVDSLSLSNEAALKNVVKIKENIFTYFHDPLSERSRLPRSGNLWSSRLETCARTFLYPYPEIGFFTVKSVKMDELTPKFDTI